MPLRSLSGRLTGRYVLLLFRNGRFVRSLPVVKPRITVGSDRWCDLVLDDPAIPARYATIADRGHGVLLEIEHERRLLDLYEPFTIGSFTLVRVPAGGSLEEAIRTVEERLRATAPDLTATKDVAIDPDAEAFEVERAAEGMGPAEDEAAPPPPSA